ncbi:MAG TPA: hypothetical protein VLZ10_16480 [Thermodesulfobacteriota bacterium]|nr:hypothetical protein [Thermodesulfobacteriota bacterium]
MKWLEVVRVRSAGKDFELVKELLRSLDKSGQPALVEMKTYYHAALQSDLSIHLHWESGRLEQDGSALGLRLAHALKEFGLTDHSVWIEEEK